MDRKLRIANLLRNDLLNFTIEVFDNSHLHKGHNNFDGLGETHILIRLVSKKKSNIDRIKIHRKINDLLSDEFTKGLHSIEIKIN